MRDNAPKEHIYNDSYLLRTFILKKETHKLKLMLYNLM